MQSRPIVLTLLLLSACRLAAQTVVPTEFLTCSRIQGNGERLACYDRAVAYLAEPTKDSVAPSAETSFGIQSRIAEPRPEHELNDALTSVTARVQTVSADRSGMKIVTLDNGQTWRQLTGSTTVVLKVGDEVTISRAALGSFLMSVPNGRPLRVRRTK